MDSTASTRMNSRLRPLHTCGVSAFAIVHEVSIKSQDLNEPLGSMAKTIVKLGSLVSSLVYALLHICLTILAYIDDCILALEDVVESVFPPSKHVFYKVDEVVRIIESLPGKFDDVLDRFPVIIEQVQCLDRAIGQTISWQKIITNILTNWGSEKAKEKKIVVETCHKESNVSVAAADDYKAKLLTESPTQVGLNNEEIFPPVSEKSETSENVGDQIAKASCAKGITYKEVLERGKKDNIEAKKDEKYRSYTDVVKTKLGGEELASKQNGDTWNNDSILELFASGWLMKSSSPVKNDTAGPGATLQRSVSYT